MLEATLAGIAVVSVISAVVIAAFALRTIRLSNRDMLAHFEATRPVRDTTAKLLEKEMDFQKLVHQDRNRQHERKLDLLERSSEITAEDVLS